jgi:hypothetical protein
MGIALLNASGKIKGTLKSEFSGKGDDYGCRAWCVDRESGERVTGPKVDWKMVKEEGWNKDKQLRDGSGVQKSKWNTMADLMFVYRAAIFLIRTNYPEVLMGMPTVEEIEDIGPSPKVTDVTNQQRLDLLLAGDPASTAETALKKPPESGAIDAKSEPAETEKEQPNGKQSAPAAPEAKPETNSTAATAAEETAVDEADLLNEFYDLITHATALPVVNEHRLRADQSTLSPASKVKVNSWADEQCTQIRGARGGKGKKGLLGE